MMLVSESFRHEILEEAMEKVYLRAARSKLSINRNKTELMLFTTQSSIHEFRLPRLNAPRLALSCKLSRITAHTLQASPVDALNVFVHLFLPNLHIEFWNIKPESRRWTANGARR